MSMTKKITKWCGLQVGCLGGGEGVTLKEQFPFLKMVWDYLWSHFFKLFFRYFLLTWFSGQRQRKCSHLCFNPFESEKPWQAYWSHNLKRIMEPGWVSLQSWRADAASVSTELFLNVTAGFAWSESLLRQLSLHIRPSSFSNKAMGTHCAINLLLLTNRPKL